MGTLDVEKLTQSVHLLEPIAQAPVGHRASRGGDFFRVKEAAARDCTFQLLTFRISTVLIFALSASFCRSESYASGRIPGHRDTGSPPACLLFQMRHSVKKPTRFSGLSFLSTLHLGVWPREVSMRDRKTYDRELRVIGQSLEARRVNVFELKTEGD